MELKIPINRSHVVQLLRACWAAVRGHHVSLTFQSDEAKLDGKAKPVVFTEDEIYHIEVKLGKFEALLNYMRETLEELPADAPEAKELRAALSVIERPRVLH